MPLFFLLIFLGICLLLFFNSDEITSRAKATLIQVIENQLGEDIEIGSITLFPLNRITLHQVKLMDGEEEFFQAERIIVSIYLPELLKGSEGIAKSIREIQLVRPEVFLVKKQDGFAFEKYLNQNKDNGNNQGSEENGGQPLELRPVIRLLNGFVHYRDEQISEDVQNLNGWVKVNGTEVDLNLKGQIKGLNQTQVTVDGSVTPTMKIELSFADLSIAELPKQYDLPLTGIKDLQGKGTGSILIQQKKNGKLSFSGRFVLDEGLVDLEQLPVTLDQLDGILTFNERQITIEKFTGRTDVGKFGLKGHVTNLTNPNLALTVTTDEVQIEKVQKIIPQLAHMEVEGMGLGSVEVMGNWQDPLVKGQLTFSELQYQDLKVENLNLKLRYQNKFVKIQELALDLGESQLKASNGYLDFADLERLSYSLNVDAENLDVYQLLSRLALPIEQEIPQGILTGKIYLSGEGFDPEDITAIGFLSIKDAQYFEMPVDQMKVDFWLTAGDLGLSKVEVMTPYLYTTLTGSIDLDGEMDLQIESSSVNLGWFGEAFKIPVRGEGTIQGAIRGLTHDPYFEGEVNLAQGHLYDQSFDQISGHIKVNQSELTLTNTSLTKGENDFRVSGSVGFARENLDIQAEVYQSSLTALREILDFMDIPFEMTGDIIGKVRVFGPWSAPQVDGDLQAVQGVVMDQPFDSAELAFRWKDSDIYFNKFKVSYQNTVLEASGMIDDYKTLDIDMSGQGFDLADIQQFREKIPQITGTANFRGKISGETTSPSFWGTISTNSIQYNDVPIEQLSALLQYEEGILKIKPMKVINQGSEYTLFGEIRFDEMQMELQIRNRSAYVSDLLRFTDLPIQELDYHLGGEIWIRGDLRRPKMILDISLGDSQNGELDVSGIFDLDRGMDFALHGTDFDLSSIKDYLPLDEFAYTLNGNAKVRGHFNHPWAELDITLNDPSGGNLHLNGLYDLNKGMNLTINGEAFDLEPFASLVSKEIDYTGKVNLNGTVNGQLDQITADLYLELVDGSVNEYQIDVLKGTVKLQDRSLLTIDQELRLADGNQISVKGTVQLDDMTGPVDLEVNMKKGNLEILPMLVPGVENASGSAHGEIFITGTLLKPIFEGELDLKSGSVKYQGLDSISDVNGQIILSPETIQVAKLNAKYGQGTVSTSGVISLEGVMPDWIDLTVKCEDFHFVYGSVNAHGDTNNLKVTGPFFAPEIRGPITVHDAEIEVLPAFRWPVSKSTGEPSKFSFAPKFYLELHPGKNVRATGAAPVNMSVTIHDKNNDVLVVDTTGEHVVLSGDLYSRNGTLNFYNTNFRITNATASFVKFNKYIPILRIQAETTINNYRIFANLEGLPTGINNLTFDLYSEPSLTYAQIVALLANQGGLGELLQGSGDVTEMISDEIWRFISQGLRNEFLNKLENSVEKALSLDLFRLDPVLLGDTKVNIQVGKYLEDNFYVVYKRTFSQNPEQSIGFEYQIQPNIGLEGTYKGGGDYQFGLKANFPF